MSWPKVHPPRTSLAHHLHLCKDEFEVAPPQANALFLVTACKGKCGHGELRNHLAKSKTYLVLDMLPLFRDIEGSALVLQT